MKILFGPVDLKREGLQGGGLDFDLSKLNSDQFEVKVFSQTNEESIYNILNSLETFVPEVLMLIFPEHKFLPLDISSVDIPIVTIFMDWHESKMEYVKTIASISDWIFTDLKGIEVLKNLGFTNTSFFPLGGYNPKHFKNLENLDKIYDISFIGCLDSSYYTTRTKLLYQLLELNDNYIVNFTQGLFNNDYTRFISQSKISFNHSVKGELNMRAYEIMKAGSLLFIEEENLEAKKAFTPFVHFIPYNSDNLLSLVEHYLNNENERELIIKNASLAVKKFTFENNIQSLFKQIKNLKLTRKNKQEFLFPSLTSSEPFISGSSIFYKYLYQIPEVYYEPKTSYQSLNNIGVYCSAFPIISFFGLNTPSTYHESLITIISSILEKKLNSVIETPDFKINEVHDWATI